MAVLTSQVVRTTNAAIGVLIDKESFNVLSKHLDIALVINELQLQELNESPGKGSLWSLLNQM